MLADKFQLVICTAFGCKRPKDALYATLKACMDVADALAEKLDALIVCDLVK